MTCLCLYVYDLCLVMFPFLLSCSPPGPHAASFTSLLESGCETTGGLNGNWNNEIIITRPKISKSRSKSRVFYLNRAPIRQRSKGLLLKSRHLLTAHCSHFMPQKHCPSGTETKNTILGLVYFSSSHLSDLVYWSYRTLSETKPISLVLLTQGIQKHRQENHSELCDLQSILSAFIFYTI